MAQVSLKNLVIAPLSAESAGSAPTYTAGHKVGHLMKANISWNRGDVKLYGDDKLVDKDNSVTSGTLSIDTTYLSRADLTTLLDIAASNTPGSGETQEYALGDQASPYVGVGYVWKDNLRSSTPYTAYWYYKVQFSMNEEMETKGESTQYKQPTIEGTVFAVQPLANLSNKFRLEADFATETAAIAWLNAKAGITSQGAG
jgi:phi13 family phage major tail protein